mgnify:CR=1 FL=1
MSDAERQIEQADLKVIASLNEAINHYGSLTPEGKESYVRMMTPESREDILLILNNWIRLVKPKE